MAEADLSAELDAFYRAYSAAFGARDIEAVEALCEYPIAICSREGDREVTNSQFYRSLLERFDRSGLAETRFTARQALRMGADCAVLVTEFRRYKSDGSPLDDDVLPFPHGCAYTLRKREDGWKIIGLADRFAN